MVVLEQTYLYYWVVPEEMEVRIRGEINSAIRAWMPDIKLVSLKIYFEDNASDIGVSIERNQVLIRMKYVLTNANGVVDSVQLTLSE